MNARKALFLRLKQLKAVDLRKMKLRMDSFYMQLHVLQLVSLLSRLSAIFSTFIVLLPTLRRERVVNRVVSVACSLIKN